MHYLFILLVIPAVIAKSYLPPFIDGTPISATVVSLDPPDLRGVPVFKIQVSVDNGEKEVPTIVHRSYREFKILSEMVHMFLIYFRFNYTHKSFPVQFFRFFFNNLAASRYGI